MEQTNSIPVPADAFKQVIVFSKRCCCCCLPRPCPSSSQSRFPLSRKLNARIALTGFRHRFSGDKSVGCLLQANNRLSSCGEVAQSVQMSVGSPNTLHAVDSAIQLQGNNRVLKKRPPPISDEKQRLNRRPRCPLSQLLSGHCHLLQDYKHVMVGESSDICTDCGASP